MTFRFAFGAAIQEVSDRLGYYAALAGLSICLPACSNNEPADPITYSVYFLGGQSNMEGFGLNSALTASDYSAAPEVMIFHGRKANDGQTGGGVGVWEKLRPGHGAGFTSDGEDNLHSDRFGPELSFGRHLQAIAPSKNIAIIKYARGGSALMGGISDYGSWDPDYSGENRINQYDIALETIRNALSVYDLSGDGVADEFVPAGIIWMQGETDAHENLEAAANYEENLTRLMDLLRAAFHTDELPVVIGRIADSGPAPQTRVMAYAPEVQAAQQRFVDRDACAALVITAEGFQILDDGWHYRSQEYLDLGIAFADAVLELETRCSPRR